jgi:hypothetical protein
MAGQASLLGAFTLVASISALIISASTMLGMTFMPVVGGGGKPAVDPDALQEWVEQERVPAHI